MGDTGQTEDALAVEWTFEGGSDFWQPISVVKDRVGSQLKGKGVPGG